ncbi:MAG: hypothetical protein IT228_11900 [Flavobacteriales bacterium]|nr:hypothetical protein [Flavobacteriales bacterium]NUQ14615.1 hypothetical protein [Flavobacteriales bacterium]
MVQIIEIINSTPGSYSKFINTEGVVDTIAVARYLDDWFRAKPRLSDGPVRIWRPSAPQKSLKFNVNVFVENSASMDGYVKGVTDFETAIYNLLADVKLSTFCDSLNLNYINSQVLKFPPDIEDFINKLEPTTFKERGGDRGTTDIKEILSNVLGRVNNRNMAVLVSDFVFSPGKNKDATEYLEQQQVGIRIDIAQKLDSFDLALAVIQLGSQFHGIYYDRNNSGIPIDNKRPYYVWLIGSREQIEEVRNKRILEQLKGRNGYMNMALYKKSGNGAAAYAVQHAKWKEGTFNRDVSKGITGAEWNKETKRFGFSIATDLSGSWQDESYLRDTSNYQVHPAYYVIKDIRAIKHDDQLYNKGYTHLLELSTREAVPLQPNETVRVELLARMPQWVNEHTSSDDTRMANDPAQMEKTFGLKHLMEGVHGAFHPDPNGSLTSIAIPITKKK